MSASETTIAAIRALITDLDEGNEIEFAITPEIGRQLIDALERPAPPYSCASTSNFPVMAERALRIIERNHIRDDAAIGFVVSLVDDAGLENANAAIQDDDNVPF